MLTLSHSRGDFTPGTLQARGQGGRQSPVSVGCPRARARQARPGRAPAASGWQLECPQAVTPGHSAKGHQDTSPRAGNTQSRLCVSKDTPGCLQPRQRHRHRHRRPAQGHPRPSRGHPEPAGLGGSAGGPCPGLCREGGINQQRLTPGSSSGSPEHAWRLSQSCRRERG